MKREAAETLTVTGIGVALLTPARAALLEKELQRILKEAVPGLLEELVASPPEDNALSFTHPRLHEWLRQLESTFPELKKTEPLTNTSHERHTLPGLPIPSPPGRPNSRHPIITFLSVVALLIFIGFLVAKSLSTRVPGPVELPPSNGHRPTGSTPQSTSGNVLPTPPDNCTQTPREEDTLVRLYENLASITQVIRDKVGKDETVTHEKRDEALHELGLNPSIDTTKRKDRERYAHSLSKISSSLIQAWNIQAEVEQSRSLLGQIAEKEKHPHKGDNE